MNIKNRAEEDRPREKLRDKGAEALSNAELLAIIIGSGTPEKDAVTLMQEVLSDCDDELNRLARMTIDDLTKYSGIGPAKAITIRAVCEIGKRIRRERVKERLILASSASISQHAKELHDSEVRKSCAEYMQTLVEDKYWEEAWILLLDQRMGLIKSVNISKGGLSETSVDVRLIIKEALKCNATNIVLCHNHPSGSPRPSREDDRLTEAVKRACDTMRLRLVDHIIIGYHNYFSYRDEDRI